MRWGEAARIIVACLLPFLLVFVAGLHASRLHAGDLSADFQHANKLYAEGKYAEAAMAYQTLVQSGKVSPALYFNLGNAFFKSGQIGRALANYRLAQELAPRDPDLRANLQFVRNRAGGGPLTPANRWRSGLRELTLNEWTGLTMALAWLWLGLLTSIQWRPEFKRSLAGFTAAAGIALGLSSVGLASRLHDYFAHTPAVIVVPEATLRYGPFDESRKFFSLKDGAELMVLDQQKDWLQVRDASQRIAWLRRDQALVLR